MGKKYTALLLILLVLVGVLAVPYIRTEYLTAKYGLFFDDLYQQTNSLEGVDYCKVLEYNNVHAKVCYVSHGESINIIEFSHIETDNWQISAWKTVWSKSGNTFHFMYPVYF